MISDKTVGVIGLGRMGVAIRDCLGRRFARVVAWNRTQWASDDHHAPTTYGRVDELLARSDLVVSCLADDRAVLDVFDVDALRGAPDDISILEMSTVSPGVMAELGARMRGPHANLIDAPVFGGPREARAGELVIPYSGVIRGDLEREVLTCLGIDLVHCGTVPGEASVVKLAGNSIVIGLVGLAAEALDHVVGSGLDPQVFARVLAHVDFSSPVLVDRVGAMADSRYVSGFALRSVLKDLDLIQADRSTEGRLQPAVHRLYREAQHSLGPDSDFAEVFRHLRGDG